MAVTDVHCIVQGGQQKMHPLYAVRVRFWRGGGSNYEVNYIHAEVTVRVAARWATVHCGRIARHH